MMAVHCSAPVNRKLKPSRVDLQNVVDKKLLKDCDFMVVFERLPQRGSLKTVEIDDSME